VSLYFSKSAAMDGRFWTNNPVLMSPSRWFADAAITDERIEPIIAAMDGRLWTDNPEQLP